MAAPESLGLSMEMQLESRDLPNMDFGSLSDPFAVIDIRDDGEWREFGKHRARRRQVPPAHVRGVQHNPDWPAHLVSHGV
jgi:hypothetical protein